MMNKSQKHSWRELKEVYDERAMEVTTALRIERRNVSRKYAASFEQIDIHLKNGGMILDAGCGTGPYSIYLSNKPNLSIIATDISPILVKDVRKTIARKGSNSAVHFVVSNLEFLPFKNETYDGLVCAQVIEHLLDDTGGSFELYRVLKPKGTLIISTDNKKNYISKLMVFPVDILKNIFMVRRTIWKYPHKDYTPSEFQQMLSKTGFHISNIMTFRYTLPSPLWQVRYLSAFIDKVEKFAIKLPLLRNWGDIILAVCHKSGRG